MKRISLVLLVVFFIETTVNSQDYKFGKVSKAELEETFYKSDSSASAAYLYRKRRTYFSYDKNEGFQVITEVHNRIKIYNKDGFYKANINIPYYKPASGSDESILGINAYTYNLENGKIVKEKMSKKAIFLEKRSKNTSIKKMTLSSIKEGSILEIKYKRVYPYWGIRDLVFQFDIPVKKLEYKVQIPEYFVFKKQSKGYYFPPLQETRDKGKISFGYNDEIDFITYVSSFSGADVPALQDDEPYVININNYRGAIKYELSSTRFPNAPFKNYATTWDDVSKQINKSSSFGGELDKTGYFMDDLLKVIETSSDEYQRVSSIYNYIKSKVTWNEYYGKYTDKGVKKAYNDGIGNAAEINLILTAMLRSAGLNANPVLVSTKTNGIPLFPTLNGFNYVISMVEFTDNSYILLDATEPYAVPNILSPKALNWNGRKIEKDGTSSWVKLTPNKPSLESNIITLKISDDNSIEGSMTSSFSDYVALGIRISMSKLDEEQLIAQSEEDYNIEIEDFKIANQKELEKKLTRSFNFFSEDYIEEINEKLYFKPLFFLALETNPFKSEKRDFPIEFLIPWQDKHRIDITLPEGYQLASLPEQKTIALPNKMGIFKYLIQASGNTVSVFSILQFNSPTISTEFYPELKEFYKQVVEKQSEKIILIKK